MRLVRWGCSLRHWQGRCSRCPKCGAAIAQDKQERKTHGGRDECDNWVKGRGRWCHSADPGHGSLACGYTPELVNLKKKNADVSMSKQSWLTSYVVHLSLSPAVSTNLQETFHCTVYATDEHAQLEVSGYLIHDGLVGVMLEREPPTSGLLCYPIANFV